MGPWGCPRLWGQEGLLIWEVVAGKCACACPCNTRAYIHALAQHRFPFVICCVFQTPRDIASSNAFYS